MSFERILKEELETDGSNPSKNCKSRAHGSPMAKPCTNRHIHGSGYLPGNRLRSLVPRTCSGLLGLQVDMIPWTVCLPRHGVEIGTSLGETIQIYYDNVCHVPSCATLRSRSYESEVVRGFQSKQVQFGGFPLNNHGSELGFSDLAVIACDFALRVDVRPARLPSDNQLSFLYLSGLQAFHTAGCHFHESSQVVLHVTEDNLSPFELET